MSITLDIYKYNPNNVKAQSEIANGLILHMGINWQVDIVIYYKNLLTL